MLRFYTLLWLEWVFRMFVVSLLLASVMSFAVTFFLYVSRETPPINLEIYRALLEIFRFWFLLLLNIAIPLALFINIKHLFNRPYSGFSLRLLNYPKDAKAEVLEEIGYADLVLVWRRWLFFIVSFSTLLVLLLALFSYIFTPYSSIFDWFDVYFLYLVVLISGFFSIVLLANRSKYLRVEKC